MQNYQGYFMNNGMYNPAASYQQMYQPVGINGRVVENFNAITANDVPMDNFGAIFIKADGTVIQRKFWDSNGRIVTAVFKPITDGNMGATSNLPTNNENALEGVLKDINGKLDELLKGRKEGAVNE